MSVHPTISHTGSSKVGGNSVHLSNLRVINGCVLFDVCSGKFHRVSETAAYVINELKHETPLSQIVNAYSKRFDISPLIAARDIELFMNVIQVIE